MIAQRLRDRHDSRRSIGRASLPWRCLQAHLTRHCLPFPPLQKSGCERWSSEWLAWRNVWRQFSIAHLRRRTTTQVLRPSLNK